MRSSGTELFDSLPNRLMSIVSLKYVSIVRRSSRVESSSVPWQILGEPDGASLYSFEAKFGCLHMELGIIGGTQYRSDWAICR